VADADAEIDPGSVTQPLNHPRAHGGDLCCCIYASGDEEQQDELLKQASARCPKRHDERDGQQSQEKEEQHPSRSDNGGHARDGTPWCAPWESCHRHDRSIRGTSVRLTGILCDVFTEVTGWVWESNVEATLRHLSHVVGYALDDLDLQALQTGVETTDAEVDKWYAYPLVGDPPVDVHLARNPGAAPVNVRVTGDLDEVRTARIETILSVLAEVRPE
jgi:hypothetical protein